MLAIIIFANCIIYKYTYSPYNQDFPFANITMQFPNKVWTVTEKDNEAIISLHGRGHASATFVVSKLPNDFLKEYTYEDFIELSLKKLAPDANIDYKIRGCGAIDFDCTTYEFDLVLDGEMVKVKYSFLKDDFNTILIGALLDPQYAEKNNNEIWSIINSTKRIYGMNTKK